MKLSMWHILQELEDFQPEYSIADGKPHIMNLYLLSRRDDGPRQSQYVYLELPGVHAPAEMGSQTAFTVSLTNGQDVITLRDIPDTSVIVNRLMVLFTSFNNWENRLRRAAELNDLQEIIDVATEKLNNPILLFDMESKVLAMSAQYLDDDSDSFWNACKQSRVVPVGFSAQALALENGMFTNWTRKPTVFTLKDGRKTIGNFINIGNNIVAGFALHEADSVIRPGDLYLVQQVQAFLRTSLQPRAEGNIQRTLIHSLQDILSGVKYEDHMYNMFHLPCEGPWRLVIIDNPYRQSGNDMLSKLQLPRLRGLMPNCVSMEFDTYIVVITPVNEIDALLGVIGANGDQPHFTVCLSLPFDHLRMLYTRYVQAAFTLDQYRGQVGVYHNEDTMLKYLFSVKFIREQDPIHPLLDMLKAHDAQKNSDLYETLFQYLINERSIQKGANAMHVHKNTYSYRLERIRELADIDLDDPDTRLYLMISYLVDMNNA